MKIACIQMNMKYAAPEENFLKAEELIKKAATTGVDTCVLPETWNTGYFPKENLKAYCDKDGKTVKEKIGSLAKELNINIVAGSVANVKNEKVYNTCYVFNRKGDIVCEYDKTHLFTPMNEDDYFTKGNGIFTFRLDGVLCGAMICYDIRFPELARTMATSEKEHLDCMFLVSQWPDKRIPHLETLTCARAIENQMFLACCNSPGTAEGTVFGGHSVIYNPYGEVLAKAGENEEIIFAECDFGMTQEIVNSINVFADRRADIYNIK